jgi:CDP-paratose synthetase
MKILVTGSTGFIGREIAYNLSKKYNTYILIRKSSDVSKMDLSNLTVLRFELYSDLIEMFQEYRFDGVIHAASSVIVNHTLDKISTLLDSNILYGTYLLESSKIANVKWFINTGTFWQHYNDESFNPVNLYAATKKAFEDIAMFYTQSSNLIFTTIKLNDTFGLDDTRAKIFNLWLKNSKSGKNINMSEGGQTIDISYIDDVVSAYAIMVENLMESDSKKYNSKFYVVSNKEKPTLKELSKIFEEVSGAKISINWGGKKYRNREVMQPYSHGNSVPNWKQKFTLRKAIKIIIQNEKVN